jgi:hypothetical protein
MKENKLMQIGRQFHKDFFEGGMEQAKQNLIKLNTMNTQENNKLIAEFMGVVFHDDENQYYNADGLHIGNTLHYHTSWDWLMLILGKIEDLNYELPEDSNLIGDITHGLVSIDIEMTFEAVVEFIKWYNQNK